MPAQSLGIIEGPNITVTATAVAIAEFLRVNLNSSGLVLLAGIAEAGIGITQQAIAASGRGVIRSNNAEGTQIGVASEAIAVGDAIYTAAAGQYSKTSGGGAVASGMALSAASGAGVPFNFIRQ